MHKQTPNISDLRAGVIDAIAWSTLLAHWMYWAKAAVALPADESGRLWKAALPHCIGLQALTRAMDELAVVVREDRALALERCEMGIREHAKGLHECWAGEPMPGMICEMIDDAQLSLARAQTMGVVFHVEHSDWISPDPTHWAEGLVERDFMGDACALMAGTLVAVGAPAAWCSDTEIDVPGIPDCGQAVLEARPQMYRQKDEGGNWSDVCVAFVDDVRAGRPLLVPVIEQGKMIYEFDAKQTRRWIEQQAVEVAGSAAPWLVHD